MRRNREALAGLLDRLRGKVEMGLKVYWDLPNVFEYFVATHQELESMRNRLFRPGRMPTVEEKVELGERFVSLLQQARQRHTRRVKEALAACCVEVRSIDPGEERMILKLACLVEKDRQGAMGRGRPAGGPALRRPLSLRLQRPLAALQLRRRGFEVCNDWFRPLAIRVPTTAESGYPCFSSTIFSWRRSRAWP